VWLRRESIHAHARCSKISNVSGERKLDHGQLYDRYAPTVHAILLARVPVDEVGDLVHDVFLRALPRLHTLRDPKGIGAWLSAIARNCANDYHRHNPKGLMQELRDDVPEKTAVKGERLDAEATTILAAIRSLPEAYRETLLLRLVEGMTGPEIAARTGLTAGSVRVNLHRGMQQLRQKLAEVRTTDTTSREIAAEGWPGGNPGGVTK
jgi:RNA polymerase sigma-70 factor (ECF subfamily)